MSGTHVLKVVEKRSEEMNSIYTINLNNPNTIVLLATPRHPHPILSHAHMHKRAPFLTLMRNIRTGVCT